MDAASNRDRGAASDARRNSYITNILQNGRSEYFFHNPTVNDANC